MIAVGPVSRATSVHETARWRQAALLRMTMDVNRGVVILSEAKDLLSSSHEGQSRSFVAALLRMTIGCEPFLFSPEELRGRS
jgi:hypothetical protein